MPDFILSAFQQRRLKIYTCMKNEIREMTINRKYTTKYKWQKLN